MPLSRQSGFTLVELMVAMAVAAILLALSLPSFNSVINSNRLTGAASDLIVSLQAARADAIRYNRRTVLCLSTNANAAIPACAANGATNATGWIVFKDANSNGAYDNGTDTLLRVATTHAAIRLLGSTNVQDSIRVIFRSDGLARNNTGVLTGTIAVCILTTMPPQNIRNVSIRGGSIAVVRASGSTCPTPGNST